ncbi:MAG: S41 family peptidase [Syntrophomonadaceae bacterium]
MSKLTTSNDVSRATILLTNRNFGNLNYLRQAMVTFVLILAICLSLPLAAFAQDNIAPEVKEIISHYYVDVPAAGVLQAATVDGVLAALNDPYSEYFTAQEYQDFIASLDEEFCGVGIYINLVSDGVEVVSVIKDSPAEAAGIKSGDIITRVDGKTLAGMASEEAAALLRGPAGSRVQLTIKRDHRTFAVSVTRRQIDVPTVTGELIKGHTGYIDIKTFGVNTGVEFGKVLEDLNRQGAKNWIIDLRDNPGGYLDSACEVAGYFIGNQTLIKMQTRDGWMDLPAVSRAKTIDKPVTILINENSASSAEVVAAAVKDYNKGTLIGKNTFGKGTIQKIFELSNGDVLKLTVARFYSPQKHEINHVGIAPDLAF